MFHLHRWRISNNLYSYFIASSFELKQNFFSPTFLIFILNPQRKNFAAFTFHGCARAWPRSVKNAWLNRKGNALLAIKDHKGKKNFQSRPRKLLQLRHRRKQRITQKLKCKRHHTLVISGIRLYRTQLLSRSTFNWRNAFRLWYSEQVPFYCNKLVVLALFKRLWPTVLTPEFLSEARLWNPYFLLNRASIAFEY